MDYLSNLERLHSSVQRFRGSVAANYTVEKSPQRVPEINELRQEIKLLGVGDLSYFEEGLNCIEFAQASRAAIVLGWTGFIDLLQGKMSQDQYASLNAILKSDFAGVHRKKSRIATRGDLSKYFDDNLLLQAGFKLQHFKKHSYKQLDAMRDERNNCAHVQEYAVTPRIALGYYAKLIAFLPSVL